MQRFDVAFVYAKATLLAVMLLNGNTHEWREASKPRHSKYMGFLIWVVCTWVLLLLSDLI